MGHRAAVIGVGQAGIAHTRAFESLGIPIGALCDVNFSSMERVRAQGLAQQAKYTPNIDDIAQDESIDIVSICTPDHAHLNPATTIIQASKHVLIEKPTVTTWEDLRTLSMAVEKAKREHPNLCVLSPEKYHYSPRNIALRDLVRSGKLGKISSVEGSYVWVHSRDQILQSWRSDLHHPYNVMAGGAWHSIAVLTWLLGLRVRRVSAIGNRKAFQSAELSTPDTVIATLEFEGEVIGVTKALLGVEITPFAPRTVFMWVVGTDGAFFTGIKPEDDVVTIGQDGVRMSLPLEGTPSWEEFNQVLFNAMIKTLVQAIDSGQEPEFSLQDAMHVTAVTLAAFESALGGGVPKDISE